MTAELNGRFPSVRPEATPPSPSVGTFFNNTTAPGLTYQPSYFQASQGLHFGPGLFKDRLRLDYLAQLQEYVATGSSQYSFRRWNGDFNHQIPLYAFFPKKLAQTIRIVPEHLCTTAQTIARGTTRIETSR